MKAVSIYLANQEELEDEIKQIGDAIQYLLQTGIIQIPEDIEIETLQSRVGDYITGLIEIEAKT